MSPVLGFGRNDGGRAEPSKSEDHFAEFQWPEDNTVS